MALTYPKAIPLTTEQIERLVDRYGLEMARYEKTAGAVADRIRRELRAEARFRYLLSFRAKHPDDLRGKLHRKREDPRYFFSVMDRNLNSVVTDLAGCRVVVYRPEDEEHVATVVDRVFTSPSRDDARPKPYRKSSGYRATHRLVLAPESDDMAIRGAICEVQITTLVAHLFNELEHDIKYKEHGQVAGEAESEALQDIERLTRVTDHMVGALFRRQLQATQQARAVDTPELLRFALEQAVGRPLFGDFVRLFRVLDGVFDVLDKDALDALGNACEALDRGQEKARQLGLTEVDDVIFFVLGNYENIGLEVEMSVRSWRGVATALKRAVLVAQEARAHDSGEEV